MANLLVDIGSTALKASWADGITLGKTFRYQGEKMIDFVISILSKEKAEVLTISSVREISRENISRLEEYCRRLVLLTEQLTAENTRRDIPEYISPDRVASITAARFLFKGKPCTIFDMGTVMTVDFIDADGNYEGGNVSIGCRTRYKALARYSKSYPLQDTPEEIPLTGTSAATAVDAGILGGMLFELSGYLETRPSNVIVFTGGDANYFAKRMKNPIFVVSNLVLMGLALIAVDNEN